MNSYFKNIEILTGIAEEKLQDYATHASVTELFSNIEVVGVSRAQKKKAEALMDFLRDHSQMLVVQESDSVLNSSDLAKKFAFSLLRGKATEEFYVIFLNSRGKVLGYERMATGSASDAVIYPRLVIETILKYKKCSAVILAHNHPGGSLTPSAQDLALTEKLKTATTSINIALTDHVIVTDSDTYSFKEHCKL